jgi:hypothetical protein
MQQERDGADHWATLAAPLQTGEEMLSVIFLTEARCSFAGGSVCAACGAHAGANQTESEQAVLVSGELSVFCRTVTLFHRPWLCL